MPNLKYAPPEMHVKRYRAEVERQKDRRGYTSEFMYNLSSHLLETTLEGIRGRGQILDTR